MKKISVLVVTLVFTSLFVISYNFSIGVTAQEEDEWDTWTDSQSDKE